MCVCGSVCVCVDPYVCVCCVCVCMLCLCPCVCMLCVCAGVLKGRNTTARRLAYSREHEIVVSAGFNNEAAVWNTLSRSLALRIVGHRHPFGAEYVDKRCTSPPLHLLPPRHMHIHMHIHTNIRVQAYTYTNILTHTHIHA